MFSIIDNVIGPWGLLASEAHSFVTNSIAFVRQFDQLVYFRHDYVIGKVIKTRKTVPSVLRI